MTVLKTERMSLRQGDAGWLDFLAIIIRKIQPAVSAQTAPTIASWLAVSLKAGEPDALDEMQQRFDDTPPASDCTFEVYRSFLRELGQWVHIPRRWLCACQPDACLPDKPAFHLELTGTVNGTELRGTVSFTQERTGTTVRIDLNPTAQTFQAGLFGGRCARRGVLVQALKETVQGTSVTFVPVPFTALRARAQSVVVFQGSASSIQGSSACADLAAAYEPWRWLFPDPDYTPEERLAYAVRHMRRARLVDEARRRAGQPALNRYEAGKLYGGLQFVEHPILGFPDLQVWLTPESDGSRLLEINEREMSLSAFQQGVTSAAGSITMAWAVTLTAGISAAASGIGPLLAGLGSRVWPFLWRTTVEDPAALFTGVEIVTTVTFGWDFGPVNAFDQIPFNAVTFVTVKPGRRVSQTARRIWLEVLEQVWESGRRLRLRTILRVARHVGDAEFAAMAHGKLVQFVGRAATGSHLAAYVVDSLYGAITREKGAAYAEEFIKKLERSDALLLGSATRLHTVAGIHRVLAEAMGSNVNKRAGARYVLEYCMANFSDIDVLDSAMRFEMLLGMPEAERFVDLFMNGTRYEFKSGVQVKSLARRVNKKLVSGEGKEKFGQLQKDLFATLGTDAVTAFDRVRRQRWVFDKRIFPAGTTEEQIADRMIDLLSESFLFSDYPLLPQLRDILTTDVIQLWAPP